MNKEELISLLEILDKTTVSQWQPAQYDILPGDLFIVGDYKTPKADFAPSKPNFKPVLKTVWEGRPLVQMLSELRNKLPEILDLLKSGKETSCTKCKDCGHYKWQHDNGSCHNTWTMETGGCRCYGYVAPEGLHD